MAMLTLETEEDLGGGVDGVVVLLLGGGRVRRRSPRMVQSAWMMVLPPRIMFWEPMMWDLRETLLPVSWKLSTRMREKGAAGRKR